MFHSRCALAVAASVLLMSVMELSPTGALAQPGAPAQPMAPAQPEALAQPGAQAQPGASSHPGALTHAVDQAQSWALYQPPAPAQPVALAHRGAPAQPGMRAVQETNLRAAAVKVDITPPIGMPLAGFGDRTGPSTGIKDPLMAGVLVLDDGSSRAAIVTLDLISIGEAETREIRRLIGERTGIAADHILVNASHTHGSPRPNLEDEYGRIVAAKTAGAAAAAVARLQPATLGYADEEVTACVNRRLINADGQAEMRPNPEGDLDSRARVIRVDGAGGVTSGGAASGAATERTSGGAAGAAEESDPGPDSSVSGQAASGLDAGEPLAILFSVACHANVYRNENTEITADYPGRAQQFVESMHGGAPAMYISGAGADARPHLPSPDGFRNGDDHDLEWVGRDVGAAVVQAAARAGSRDQRAGRVTDYRITARTRMVDLPGKDGESIAIEIQALRVGPLLFVTIPGEPFIAYNRQVEAALGADDLHAMVVGYANGSHGYFCTEESYRFGGYEPGVSRFAPAAEGVLVDALVALGREVLEGSAGG